ncbi:MAG: 16S rRNA (uracil(1498)-N(3))-methyltransferase [Thermodesulfovibrionia bacterium]
MIRIFLPPEDITSKQIIIRGEQARHLSLVLRVKTGDSLAIFDGQGHRYICKISSVHKKEVLAEKINKEPYSAESTVSITLAQGVPKGNKMDFIVQKSTELGVKKIIPLITEYSQVRKTGRIERWRKIALSASQQSGREKIPEIAEPVNFKGFLAMNDICYGIIFSEGEKGQSLKKTLNDIQAANMITLLIGPEGGFSEDEVSTAIQKGFISVSLGPRILRTETAPITALSIIQYELGDMG